MYCWYLYFSVKTIFSFYLVAWVGAVSNVRDNFLFMKFPGLLHVFSLVYELLFNTFVHFFRKYMNLLSVLRKYVITRYAFTSVHSMKKAKTRMGHQVVPHLLSKPN